MQHAPRFIPAISTGLLLAGALSILTAGCAAPAGSATPPSAVQRRPAVYPDLENRVVAVLVETNPIILVRHRLIGYEIAGQLSRKLARNLNQVQVIEPEEVMLFQRENAFWPAMTDRELCDSLKAQRLVVVELTAFELIESAPPFRPWGQIQGAVTVVENGGGPEAKRTFSHPFDLQYPARGPLETHRAQSPSLRLALIDRFCEEAARLFYDHEVLP